MPVPVRQVTQPRAILSIRISVCCELLITDRTYIFVICLLLYLVLIGVPPQSSVFITAELLLLPARSLLDLLAAELAKAQTIYLGSLS